MNNKTQDRFDRDLEVIRKMSELRVSDLIRENMLGGTSASSCVSTSINKQDILDAIKKIPKNPMGPFGQDLFGMRVYEEPLPPPKLELSENLDLDPEFRREFNQWLLSEFGRKESICGDNIYFSTRYGFMVTPHGGAAVIAGITA